MSTKLPTSPHGFTLVSSGSLALTRALADAQSWLVSWLLSELRKDGYPDLTAHHLIFLGELDCGVNHAAELARRMGVTRQAIHKSVRDLAANGWLETQDHPELGNQRVILFTREGENLMALARKKFAALDQEIDARLGKNGLQNLLRNLDILSNPESEPDS